MNRLLNPLRALFALLALSLCASAFAQYPNRPITMVVPWGAGGGTDATARIGIWDCAGHLAGWCPLHEASIGEDDEFCRGALNEARAILTTDDPAAVAALAATLAERHPDALLTALTNAGVLTEVTP